ncbi:MULTISPECIES: DUF6538 domain-containing protein [Bradyrhizobium]|uniref:DUF6538 domain-containing protein n=1 Tax=Bradyrhizobium japonicum TaxID=375 RepID=A0A1Y2JT68_BRAJP|nr:MULTISPECIES: DUF6538 domain-containing protein [Bradyrhizobium]OSJ35015.1 hypothetical protein BSZ19_10205 [Bradyrhizobium japonicum]TFW57882.1 hypothetical protein CT676_27160 [Bradyrhizobium sp. MOS001]
MGALGTPRRHPESGIFWLWKRVPDRLQKLVGKREIKISLRTRDPGIARIRYLEAALKIELSWERDATPIVGAWSTQTPPIGSLGIAAKPAVEIQPEQADVSELAASRPQLTLRSVFKSYANEAQLAPSTLKRWEPVIERLIDHLGHDQADRISRSNIVAWKKKLLEMGMSNITVRDVYLAAAKATLQFAVDQEMLLENPAAGIRVRVKDSLHERDKGFSGEEARTILAATVRPPSNKISIEMAAARRWVPWICAYNHRGCVFDSLDGFRGDRRHDRRP